MAGNNWNQNFPPLGFGGQPGGWGPRPGMPGGPYPGFNPIPPQLNQQKKNKKGKKAKKATDSPVITTNSPSPSPMKAAQANFMKEPTPAATKEATPLPGANDWPPSLKNYVSRCFSKCVTDVDKDMVEVILKGKITAAASSNTLWSKNWDEEPLPSNLSNSKQ